MAYQVITYYVTLVCDLLQALTFVVFLCILLRLLRRMRFKLDKQMRATLWCLGISIFIWQVQPIWLIVYGPGVKFPDMIDTMAGFASQGFEKTGILIDIGRLSTVLIKMHWPK